MGRKSRDGTIQGADPSVSGAIDRQGGLASRREAPKSQSMPRSSRLPEDPAPVSSAGRRRWFRLAVVVGPFLVLAGIEWSLRVTGHHQPTGFWVSSGDPGELMPNPEFASRFVGR